MQVYCLFTESYWCFPQVQTCLQSSERVPAARLPYRVKVSSEKRYAWCACGHSQKQVRTWVTVGLPPPTGHRLFTEDIKSYYVSFCFSLSVMGLTRPRLQASLLSASPLKRAKRSCCVRARKPKTRRTATAHTLRSSSRMWWNRLKAFLNPESGTVHWWRMSRQFPYYLISTALIESDDIREFRAFICVWCNVLS